VSSPPSPAAAATVAAAAELPLLLLMPSWLQKHSRQVLPLLMLLAAF
jgi:hypothetical protein